MIFHFHLFVIHMKTIFISFSLLLTLFSSTHAQWSQCMGPYGGPVTAIAKKDSMLFVGFDNIDKTNISSGFSAGSLYRSSDNGVNWVQKDSVVNAPLKFKSVFNFTFIGSIIFASTSNGIFRSTDNGDTWRLAQHTVSPIVVMDSIVIMAGDGSGLSRSLDSGKTWTEIKDVEHLGYIQALFVQGSSVFAGRANGRIYKSTDYGITWKNAEGGADDDILCFAVKDTMMFAGTATDGILSSSDNGNSWNQLKYVSASVRKIYVVDSTIYAYSNLVNPKIVEFCQSTDNGKTWTKFPSTLQYKITGLFVDGNDWFALTDYGGIYYSSDKGITWTPRIEGITVKNIPLMHTNGTTLFAAAEGGAVYNSKNNGLSWNLFDILPSTVRSFASNSSFQLVRTDGGVYRFSISDGKYIKFDSGMVGYICTSIEFINNTILAGSSKGIFRRMRVGDMWYESNVGLTDKYVKCITVYGTVVFTETNSGGMFRSTDEGNSWAPVNSGLIKKSIYSLISTNYGVFAGTRTGVFRSTDLGESWIKTNAGMDTIPSEIKFAKNSKYLFVMKANRRVYRSANNGEYWEDITFSLKNVYIQDIAANDDHIFVGTRNAGVWKLDLSTVGVDENLNSGISSPSLLICYPNPATNTLTIDRTSLQFPENTTVHYTLSTLIGGKVMEFDNKESRFTVQLEGMAGGVYCLTAESGGNRAAVMVTVVK